jgi:hypothetical protein
MSHRMPPSPLRPDRQRACAARPLVDIIIDGLPSDGADARRDEPACQQAGRDDGVERGL